ncbi:MAG: hypothetical protein LUO86_06870 [Methanomicrobiales archaeon]|nr:hypothetical protein [Methanomicrobiales archaeon]
MASVRKLLFVRESPTNDEMNLCVRMSIHDRPNGIGLDDWVKLTFVETGKSVVCRLKDNDDPSGSVQLLRIHINSHLRNMLGIESNKVSAYLLQEFSIAKMPSWAFFWYVHCYHPDRRRRRDVAALTLLIGGIILGLVGIALPFILR